MTGQAAASVTGVGPRFAAGPTQGVAASTAAGRYAQMHADRFVADVARLIGFASVTGAGSRKPLASKELGRCANWLAARLRSAGMDAVRLVPSGGPPVVLARAEGRRPHPHVLVYGHYDVVAPGPGWATDPFRAERIGPYLYGRGASDDKGPVMAQVAALESLLLGEGGLPVTTTCLFEGEEESGSPGLPQVLRAVGPELDADVLVVSDTRMLGPGRPALVRALRGAVSLELRVCRAGPPLHSGRHGGSVVNPAHVLGEVLSGITTSHGELRLTGLGPAGVVPSPGHRRRARRSGSAPTLTITSLRAGRPGLNAVPRLAVAHLDARFGSPHCAQDIVAVLRRRLRGVRDARPETTFRLRIGRTSAPVELDVDHAATWAAAAALTHGFGRPPVLVDSGGSIAAVGELIRTLGLSAVLMGFGLPDDGAHSVDERLHLPTFRAAVQTCIHLHHILGRTPTAPLLTDSREVRRDRPC